jgi:RNA polymerase sigma-70 factor (ECF subfamily)
VGIFLHSEGSSAIVSANDELERLVADFGDGVLKYCHSILLDYHEAQDVVQSVFVAAFNALGKGSEISGSWLYRSGYNLCIDILRRKKFARFFSFTREEPTYNDTYFMSDEVAEMLKTLSPKDRALVFSRAVEGKSYEQLEAIYGIKANALRQRYARAKKKLMEVLSNEK